MYSRLSTDIKHLNEWKGTLLIVWVTLAAKSWDTVGQGETVLHPAKDSWPSYYKIFFLFNVQSENILYMS